MPSPSPKLPQATDRISIGDPRRDQTQGVIPLPREDDLASVPQGDERPQGDEHDRARVTPQAAASAAPGTPRTAATTTDAPLVAPGSGRSPEAPSLAQSLRRLQEQQLAGGLGPGDPTGTVQQMGPLIFDPRGADFTAWVNHLKNEIYRNWIVPPSVLMGARGHVDLQFTVDGDGRMSDVRLLKSSGTPALDRAAANALLGSRPRPLPEDYGPPSVTIQISFFYNQGPQGS